MENAEMAKESAACRSQGPSGSLRVLLKNRKLMMLTAAVVIAGGLVLNWGWLVAVGLAPLILSVLPCLAMCALGLCMNKLVSGRGACANTQAKDGKVGTAAEHTDNNIAGERTTP